MSTADVIRTALEFAAAVGVVLCFVFEKRLIAFENRVAGAIKSFFKGVNE